MALPYTTPLCPLMDRYGSDKGPRKGNTTHHTYTQEYHALFNDKAGTPLTVFEMGLGTNNPGFPCGMGPNGRPGASLRAWRDYFPLATIYGADIDPGILFEEDRIRTLYCDQTAPTVVRAMWEALPDMDIIIDDGLHTFDANVTFFETSIHKLSPAGLFIIEDIDHKDLPRFRRKIQEWTAMYPTRLFELRVLSGGNPYDNNMLVVKPITISVSIPTMRRFSFLKDTIPKYLENPHVSELIVCDETGEDYAAITAAFSHPKLRVYQNESRLGMLKNKLRAASYATSDYIAILDSDNFADRDYFEAFKVFLSSRRASTRSVFLPSYAKPTFNYREWVGKSITRDTIRQMYPAIDTCLNTMNSIISREFLSTFEILSDTPMCDEIGCYDSKYFALYTLFQMNGTLHVVNNMEYEHCIHDESGWQQTHMEFETAHAALVEKYLAKPYLQHAMTLSHWQSLRKSPQDLIVQASSTNEDDAWMPFPIGMNYTFPGTVSVGDHSQTVLCALNPNTDGRRRPTGVNRHRILQTLAANGIQNEVVAQTAYFDRLPFYKFVVSPEGNGIDCHRHYEALLSGCIPIIERNPLVEQKYSGCPILWTVDYSEITPDYLALKYQEMSQQVYDFSRLFLRYYSPETQADIKRCGNYWMVRLGRAPFYASV